MYQKYSRTKSLPIFRCDIAALESLLKQLSHEFPGEPRVTVEVEEHGRQMGFNSLRELTSFPDLPPEVRRLTLKVHSGNGDNDPTMTLTCGADGFNRTSVDASSPSEAWCAGIVESVWSFTNRHRVWWSFAPRVLYLTGYAMVIGVILSPALATVLESRGAPSVWRGAALLILGMFIVLWSYFIGPLTTVVIRREDNVWKRKQAEIVGITAIVVAVAAVATAVGTFWPR